MPMRWLCLLLVLLAPLTFAQEQELPEFSPDDFEVSAIKYEFLQPIPPQFLNRDPALVATNKEQDTLSIMLRIQCPPLDKNQYEIANCDTTVEVFDDSYIKKKARAAGWSQFNNKIIEVNCYTKEPFNFGELTIGGEIKLQLNKWDENGHKFQLKDILDIPQTIENLTFSVVQITDINFRITYEEVINGNQQLNKIDMTDKNGNNIGNSYSTTISQSNNVKKISREFEINKKSNGDLISLDDVYITVKQGTKSEPIIIPFEFTLPVEFSNKQEQGEQTQPTLKEPNA